MLLQSVLEIWPMLGGEKPFVNDVQAAILAVHLNMLDEAEQLLAGCGRYDLLNKLYQDSGQWNKALDVCENNDRIHLRNTYYNYAKHLEAMGDLPSAVPMYEKHFI